MASSPVYRFGPYRIDTQRHVLLRDDSEVPLSPHLVDILTHLVAHGGQVVTKNALLDTFWPDVHVTENTLTRAIADIRKALADDASEPKFIQTVARRGYRFVAAVEAPAGAMQTRSARHDGTRQGSENPFREWVRGRLSLESLDAARLPGAILAFEHAVAATPDYAPAHVGLANACFLKFESTRAENAPDRAPLTRALAHARQACELDPSLGEAWATLGFVLMATGQTVEARAAALRAAALEPTSWRHHFRVGITSWGEERLRAVDRTLSLLPGFAPARFIAAMVFIARQAFGPAAQVAAAGAAAQSREAVDDESPFPAVGLHWLHGVLLLRQGEVGGAISSFASEIDHSFGDRIYSREFRTNAQVSAGFAHLSIHDAAGAADAFRSALETLPRNGRALIGLYRALMLTSFAAEAAQLLPQVDAVIGELAASGRPGEAAIVSAASLVARGDRSAACTILQRLLDEAPPGQAGWLIPIDPSLAELRTAPGFERLAAKLAARAS